MFAPWLRNVRTPGRQLYSQAVPTRASRGPPELLAPKNDEASEEVGGRGTGSCRPTQEVMIDSSRSYARCTGRSSKTPRRDQPQLPTLILSFRMHLKPQRSSCQT